MRGYSAGRKFFDCEERSFYLECILDIHRDTGHGQIYESFGKRPAGKSQEEIGR